MLRVLHKFHLTLDHHADIIRSHFNDQSDAELHYICLGRV